MKETCESQMDKDDKNCVFRDSTQGSRGCSSEQDTGTCSGALGRLALGVGRLRGDRKFCNDFVDFLDCVLSGRTLHLKIIFP